MATQPLSASDPRPLFGGYALVAVTLAWLAGIALRAFGPLPGVPALAWLLIAALAVIIAVALARWIPPSAAKTRRALLMAAILLAAMTGTVISDLIAGKAATVEGLTAVSPERFWRW